MSRRLRHPYLLAVTLGLLALVAGCDGETEREEPPRTDFAAALASVGGGSGATGVGWVEPARVARGPARTELIGDAVGPNASSLVDSARTLRRRFGLDPLSADALVSVGGSYAFALRLDGVDGSGLARALDATAARTAEYGGFALLEAGGYASVPGPLLEAGVRGLGAFDAVGEDAVVLAISERARAALIGAGDPRVDAPVYAAAAECLGDVVAAKLTPDSNIVSTDLGVSLVAAGVREDGSEVLCTLGGDGELAAQIESNFRRLLAPDSTDPIGGGPLGESIAAVTVDRGSPFGVESVRATIGLAPGQDPGYAFELVSGAAVVGLINGEGRTFEPFGTVESPGADGG